MGLLRGGSYSRPVSQALRFEFGSSVGVCMAFTGASMRLGIRFLLGMGR